jgi:DNA-binding PadR family transcriptional regulator
MDFPATSKALRTELTELEACVLGAIWLHGPCSAYAIRREFEQSPSSYWSSSTGAIYPAIRRLQGLGLASTAAQSSDRRGRRDVAITPAGEGGLRAWVAHLPDWTAMPTRDAIRSRMNFLGVLKDPRARMDFVEQAERAAIEQIASLKVRVERAKDVSEAEYFATLGSLHEIYGRLRWLRLVRRRLGS